MYYDFNIFLYFVKEREEDTPSFKIFEKARTYFVYAWYKNK